MNTSLYKLLGVATMIAGLVPSAPADLKIGDDFPDLAKFKLDGPTPAAFKGKVVIVDFWASWCGPCKESFPAMNELQQKFGDRGLVIVAINEDEEKSDMQEFLKSNPTRFTVVRDAAQKLVAVAGIQAMPSSFVLDVTGKIRFIHRGFHGAETRKEYEQQIESLLKQ